MKEKLHTLAQKMYQAAIKAVDPFQLIMDHCAVHEQTLHIRDLTIDLTTIEKIYILGAGKASAPMAVAMEQLLGDRIADGVVIVKYGHAQATQKIKIREAGHPIPDANSLNATAELLEVAGKCGENDLVIFLLSGGGSALLEQLPPEINLGDLQELNRLLLACGANIEEINTVRKHISLVKGGQLAKRVYPARLISLILSDVIGDPLSGIASGPTAPDNTTFEQAWQILTKYGLVEQLPLSIKKYLQKGLTQQISETPKKDDLIFRRVTNLILGNNRLALKAARNVARKNGFNTIILTDQAQGEVSEISKLLSALFKSTVQYQEIVAAPGCLLIGGEPTVHLKGNGLGGRNQELTLHLLKQLKTLQSPFYFASIGTDGTDGPTDAAGAWIDRDTFFKTLEKKMEIEPYLANNDSYHFFEKLNQLIKTGPTGTNVMDMMIFLFTSNPE